MWLWRDRFGTPAEIYDQPNSEFVMRFIGETNIISSARRHFPDLEIADHHQVFLRPHDLAIRSEPEENFAPATVSYSFNLGWEGQAELVLSDNQKLIVKLERDRFDSLSPSSKRSLCQTSKNQGLCLILNKEMATPFLYLKTHTGFSFQLTNIVVTLL